MSRDKWTVMSVGSIEVIINDPRPVVAELADSIESQAAEKEVHLGELISELIRRYNERRKAASHADAGS